MELGWLCGREDFVVVIPRNPKLRYKCAEELMGKNADIWYVYCVERVLEGLGNKLFILIFVICWANFLLPPFLFLFLFNMSKLFIK